MKYNVILTVSIVLLSLAPCDGFPQNKVNSSKKSTQQDTVSPFLRIMFFLDGKQVTEKIIREKADKNELSSGFGHKDHRAAIIAFGERYKYGAFFYKSVGKENENNPIEYNSIRDKIGRSANVSLKSVSNQDKNLFNLNGKIDPRYNGKCITLFTFRNDTVFTADTCTVRNGAFRFKGKEHPESFSLLSLGNYPETTLNLDIVLEKGDINANITKSAQTDSIGGTPLNDLYQSYWDSIAVSGAAIKLLEKTPDESPKPGTPLYDKYVEQGHFSVNFKKNNINNIVGQKLFRDEAGKRFGEAMAYGGYDVVAQIITDAANDELKNQDWLKNYLQTRKEILEKRNAQKKHVNKAYTDFEFQTPEGETKKLSDYIGNSKYTVIDFWASWCGPCIAEIPNLKTVYNKYKNDDVKIISISLDKTKNAWQKGLDKINAPWVHLCDFNGNRSKLTATYDIVAIPFIMLLDKNGTIIDLNLRGQSLDNKLQKLLNY